MAFSRTQTFAAGNSATSMDQSGWNPSGSQPGGDPLYPYLVYADEVHVDTGPNRLTKWASGNWDFLRWWEAEYGDEVSGLDVWWHAQSFVYAVTIDVLAEALTENTYCPSFLQSADSTGPTYDSAIGLSLFKTGSNWGLELFYRSYSTGTEYVQTYTFPTATISDKTVVLRVEGCCGTPTLSGELITAVASDGYITATIAIDGGSPTTAYSLTGLDLYISDTHNNRLRGFEMGAGFAGDIVSVLTSGDSTCGAVVDGIDPPPTDASTPCPCPGAPGGIDTVPNPIGDLPPWIASCDGGCNVDSVADVAVGEVWL